MRLPRRSSCECRSCSRSPGSSRARGEPPDRRTPLACASQQQPGPHPPGQAQHVVSAQVAGFGSFDRVELVVDRGGRASQMPDPIHLELDRLGHVVADQLKAGMADPLGDVDLAAGEVIIEANHLLTGLHQPIHQVGAHKTRSACNQVARQRSEHQFIPPRRATH